MNKALELSGKTFGKLTVIKRIPNVRKGTRWLCRCSCGNYVEVDGCHLRNGGVKSCGCILKEQKWNIKHNMSKTRLYEIWRSMKRRCLDKNLINYKNYGGRGIIVCVEWKDDFKNFYEWAIKNGYKENLSIDRKDVNGNYCPENCRWADSLTQANNKRTNVFIEYKGILHTVAEWSRILDIKRTTLEKRLKTKTVKEAFENIVDSNKSHHKTFEEWK